MATFIFLATAWGPSKGGINSFNHSLCTALAKHCSSSKVICIATATQPDIDAASEEDVCLVSLDVSYAKQNPEYVSKYVPGQIEKNEDLLWIGHDIYTGELANTFAKLHGGLSVVFHHTDFEAYYLYGRKDNARKNEKVSLQKEVMNNADIVFGVGPTLYQSAHGMVTSKSTSVFQIIPGLESIDITPTDKSNKSNTILMFGRAEDHRVKQTRLSAIAAAKAINNLDKPHSWKILITGYDNSQNIDYEDIEKEVEANGGRPGCLKFADFTVDRNKLFDSIKDAKICLMPSKYEGFGLSGLEAIAAETPLIITENSGLYAYLEGEGLADYVSNIDIKGTNVDGAASNEDIDALSKAIEAIGKDYQSKLAGAEKLKKELLRKGCIWSRTVSVFLEKISERNTLKTTQKATSSRRRKKDFHIDVDDSWCDFFSIRLLPLFSSCLLPKGSTDVRKDMVRCIVVRFEGSKRYSWFDDKNKRNSRKKLRPKSKGVVGMMLESQKTILHDFNAGKSYCIEWPDLVDFKSNIDAGNPEGCVLIIASPIIVDNEIAGAITFDIAEKTQINDRAETELIAQKAYPEFLKPFASKNAKTREREMKRIVEEAEHLAATVADYYKFCKYDFK